MPEAQRELQVSPGVPWIRTDLSCPPSGPFLCSYFWPSPLSHSWGWGGGRIEELGGGGQQQANGILLRPSWGPWAWVQVRSQGPTQSPEAHRSTETHRPANSRRAAPHTENAHARSFAQKHVYTCLFTDTTGSCPKRVCWTVPT